MCNRARGKFEPETLREKFGAKWGPQIPNTSTIELTPKSKAPVIRSVETQRIIDLMRWDVLGGQASWPMTNVRDLGTRWKSLAAKPAQRCLIPLTEFCEWEQEATDLNDGKKPIKAERWFQVTDQPIFAVAGFWQQTAKGDGFTMVTCDANELVEPIHPKAMITILKPEDWDTWLHGSYDEAVALQRPYPAELMTVGKPEFPTRQPKAQASLI
jgi:putative SOS response-associated peptidase YedK